VSITVPEKGGCDPCRRGDHSRCWAATSNHPEDVCPCYDAADEAHHALNPWQVMLDDVVGAVEVDW
jgi:hypothetical protein